MTNQVAAPDTRSRLAEAFDTRDKAIADLARILGAISRAEEDIKSKSAELASLGERLDVVNAAVALGEAPAEDAAALEQALAKSTEEAKRLVGMTKGLIARRDAAQPLVGEARLAVARELEGIAWPVFDEISREAVDHFTRFLDAVRRRCQLAATVTAAFRSAGEMRSPMDEESVERSRFLGEFGLNSYGLEDLLPKYSLKLTPTGLGFLPMGEMSTLTETELLALPIAEPSE